MARQLLIDTILFDYDKKLLKESVGSSSSTHVRGVLQRANAKNHNGRVYPKNILAKQAQVYNDTFIKEKRAYGELDHPEKSVVEFKNTSHVITKMWWEGDDLVGDVLIMPTPAGNILKVILAEGLTVGISSRGLGSVREINEDTSEVQEDFELIAFDFVTNPSTKGAFLRPVRNESRQLTESTAKVIPAHDYTRVNDIIYDIICNTTGVCKLK